MDNIFIMRTYTVSLKSTNAVINRITESFIHPISSHHVSLLSCCGTVVTLFVTFKIKLRFCSHSMCYWFLSHPVSPVVYGPWSLNMASKFHQWQVLPLESLVVANHSLGGFFFQAHFPLPLSFPFYPPIFVCSYYCWGMSCLDVVLVY